MKKIYVHLFYSLGYIGIAIILQTTIKWYQYFYAPPVGNPSGLKILVPIGLIGFAMVIARVFDSIANPVVAFLSDTSKNKMGRRIPFILFGSFPLVLTFLLLWFPPVNVLSIYNFIYLSVLLSALFIFFTIVTDPYLALLGEITENREERIRLTSMQGVAQIAGVMIAEAGSAFLIKASGFKLMAVVLGIIALFTILLTPFFVKERLKDENIETAIPEKIEKHEYEEIKASGISGIIGSIRKTLTNRNFIYYIIPYLAIWSGINTLTIAMPYITEILLKMPAANSGFLIAGTFVVALLFSPILPIITIRMGKKKILLMTCLMLGLILFCTGFFGTVFNRLASIVITLLAGIPLVAALIVPNAIVADIAEIDGKESGERREGMFFGAQGLIQKLVIGMSSLLTPLLFSIFGCTASHPLGLRICGPLTSLFLFLSLIAFRKYSVTEKSPEPNK